MAVMPYFLDVMLPILKKQNILGAKLCTLSRQDVYATQSELEQVAKKYDYDLRHLSVEQIIKINLEHPVRKSDASIVNDQIFWRQLGFDSVVSIDASAFELATNILDLNLRRVPDDLRHASDWVIDIGTMEHVFHIPNYLANLFDLVRTDGFVWQTVPCNNWVNHGFYQFSPTLLNDFYVQNGWKIHGRYLFQINEHWASSIRQYSYEDEPNFVTPHPIQQLDDQFYLASILAQKIKGATCDRTIQQYTYLHDQWTPGVKSTVTIKNVVVLNRTIRIKHFLTKAVKHPRLFFKDLLRSVLLRVMSEGSLRKLSQSLRRPFSRSSA